MHTCCHFPPITSDSYCLAPPKLPSISSSQKCTTSPRQATMPWLFPRAEFISAAPLHLITSCLEASLGRVKDWYANPRSELKRSVCCEPCYYLLCWDQSWVEIEFLATQLSYLKGIELGEVALRWCVCRWGDDSSFQWFAGILSSPDNGYYRWNMSS